MQLIDPPASVIASARDPLDDIEVQIAQGQIESARSRLLVLAVARNFYLGCSTFAIGSFARRPNASAKS